MGKKIKEAIPQIIFSIILGIVIGAVIQDVMTTPEIIYIYNEPPKVIFI